MTDEKKKLIKEWCENNTDKSETIILESIACINGKICWCADICLPCNDCDFGFFKNHDNEKYVTCYEQKLLWSAEKKKLIKEWVKKHTVEIENIILEAISLVNGKICWCEDTICTDCDFGKYKNIDNKERNKSCDKLKNLWSNENDTKEKIKMDNSVMEMVRNFLEKEGVHSEFDVYIVWKCKTLQNWKYLISTTIEDGRYYEVTYDGDRGCWYFDVYKKEHNEVIGTTEPS